MEKYPSLKALAPELRRSDRGVLLVSLAPGSKKPLWYPGGWLIVTHDGRGESLGWSVGPKTQAAFPKHEYAKSDLFLLHPKTVRPNTRMLLKSFLDSRDASPKWRGVLYLPARQIACVAA